MQQQLPSSIHKQEELQPSLIGKVQSGISTGPHVSGDNSVAHTQAGSNSKSHSEVCNPKLSSIDLLRRKEKFMKMNVDAVIQVVLETSKSSGNNVIKMENRGQKLNAHWESCSEIRDEIIALLPDSQIGEEAQKWIEYQQAIDNTLDIAQEYLFELASKNMDEQTAKVAAEHKQSHLKLPKLELPKLKLEIKRQRSVALSLTLQQVRNKMCRSMTAFSQGQHFSLTLYQFCFGFEHIKLH